MIFTSRLQGPICEVGTDGTYVLQDPDGSPCGNNEDAATYCAELCWEPEQTTMSAYGQSSVWLYAAVGTMDFTLEASDRLFNWEFMHSSAGPQIEKEVQVKNIVTEFTKNYREAIKDWFNYFLYSTSPFQFTGPGLTGHITDAQTGAPLLAVIEVEGFTSSLIADRTSDHTFGRFWRLLPAGTYSITVSAIGYTDWNGNINVKDNGPLTELNVGLNSDNTTVAETLKNLFDSYLVSPAYPNPFNAETQFMLTIKQRQSVEIDIYNILGKKIANLHKGMLEAKNTHIFKFHATKVPSGLYIVSIRGEYFRTDKRVILIK